MSYSGWLPSAEAVVKFAGSDENCFQNSWVVLNLPPIRVLPAVSLAEQALARKRVSSSVVPLFSLR